VKVHVSIVFGQLGTNLSRTEEKSGLEIIFAVTRLCVKLF